MDVLPTSPPQIYTHLTVKVATDPQLQDSICSISNSCLLSLQRYMEVLGSFINPSSLYHKLS